MVLSIKLIQVSESGPLTLPSAASPCQARHLVASLMCLMVVSVMPAAAEGGERAARASEPGRGSFTPVAACDDGIVNDDGTVENGYGWVPSVVQGEYVQEFSGAPRTGVDSVCVCWLRTRADQEIDFELVFYADVGGKPAEQPYYSRAASATGVPSGITGAFYEVPVDSVPLATDPVYIGVRWDPSAEDFFFVCADWTPTTPEIPLFLREDLFFTWGNALDSAAPTFTGHRAALIRVTTSQLAIQVPTLSGAGLALLGLLLILLASQRLANRRASSGRPGRL